jgi:carboxyl-terminal processing protease
VTGGEVTHKGSFVFAAALVAFAALVLQPVAAAAQLAAETKQLDIDSFEYVWKTIRDRHFDPTLGGLDWQAVHDELRPKVESAQSIDEARSAMIDMISRLRQSHFAIIPADVYENIEAPAGKGDRGGSTGIELRVIDGKAIVTSVKPGMPAERAGVRPGWEMRSIRGEEIPPLFPPIEKEFEKNPRMDFYLWYAARARLGGSIGDTVTAIFMDEKDRPTEKTMILEEPRGKRVIFGNLPAFYLTFRADTLRDGIGYFTFSTFFDPVTLMPAFGNAMQSFMKAPGIVIDVRGNPGGIAGMGLGMAGWFVGEKNVAMGTMRTRSDTLKLVINPRARVYRGPVAILVDGLSGSSSEIFAGGVQGLPQVRIFGSRTAGATLPSMAERLPNGDGFQYAFASYISRNGVELEGEGVKPDVEIRPTRKALLEGRDPAIEAAVDWIRNRHYKGN